MLKGFSPVADADARVLILGTMPSVASIRVKQYYGHPQNAFWKIIFSLWDRQVPAEYEHRTRFLIEKRIALWDVLSACEREGSADSNIKQPAANDFNIIADKCPMLEAVFFNSQNAAKLYKRLVVPDVFSSLKKITLPSTSPARAMKFEKKLSLWMPVRDYLEHN